MDLLLWIVGFTACSLFWAWILFLGGAEWLEGSFLSGFLLWWNAPDWSSDGIKVFAAGTWFFQTIWFLFGLFSSSARW